MIKQSQFVLIRVMVPLDSADKVRQALGDVGAGKQGNYEFCSSSYKSTGRFKPLEGSNPTIGKVGKPEIVEEETIETLCNKDLVEKVILALKKAHPYECPAIDIIPRLDIS